MPLIRPLDAFRCGPQLRHVGAEPTTGGTQSKYCLRALIPFPRDHEGTLV